MITNKLFNKSVFKEALEIIENTNIKSLVAYIFLKKKIKIRIFNNKNRNQEYKIFIIGSGTHAMSNIVPNILIQNFRIDLIHVRNISKGQLIQKIYNISTTDKIENFLNQISKKDKVLILSSSKSHYDLIEKFCNIECQLFIEKPIVSSKKDFQKLLQIKNEINLRKILIGYNRNFSEAFNFSKKILNTNTDSNFEINYRVNFGPKVDNKINRYIENCCHYVFFVLSLTDKKIKSINIFNDKQYNNVHLSIKFEDNSLASIQLTSEGTRNFGVKETIQITKDNNNYEIRDFKVIYHNDKKYIFKFDIKGYKKMLNSFISSNFKSNFDETLQMSKKFFFK